MQAALFYTFSTIAQTVAAALAVLGAFVLYRLNQYGVEMAEHSETVALRVGHAPEHQEELRRLDRLGDWEGVFRYSAIPSVGALLPTNPAAPDARALLGAIIARRKRVLRLMGWSAGLTLALLILSIAVLALTPAILSLPWAPAVTLMLGVVLFVACLGAYTLTAVEAFE